jgi:hypothetical protein
VLELLAVVVELASPFLRLLVYYRVLVLVLVLVLVVLQRPFRGSNVTVTHLKYYKW